MNESGFDEDVFETPNYHAGCCLAIAGVMLAISWGIGLFGGITPGG